MQRPAVSIVIPFFGGRDDLRATVDAMGRIDLRPDDEIFVVDNTPDQVSAGVALPGGMNTIRAPALASSYYARNVGGEAATNEWLLFLDADTVPTETLLDDYFCEPIGERVGAVAGEVDGEAAQRGFVVDYQRARRHLGQREVLDHAYRPMAVTANVLIRTAAWIDLGGFMEGIRSSGDMDFSWRLRDHGWTIAYQPQARVQHVYTVTLRGLARRFARYGAGGRWARRRHPDHRNQSLTVGLCRAVAGAIIWPLLGQPRRGLYKAMDGFVESSRALGGLLSNRSSNGRTATEPTAKEGAQTVCFVVSEFPRLHDDVLIAFASVAQRQGHDVIVEARARAVRPVWAPARELNVRYWEDDGPLRRAADAWWLAVRRLPKLLVAAVAPGRRGPLGLGSRVVELAPAARRLHDAPVALVFASADLRAQAVAEQLSRFCVSAPKSELAKIAARAPAGLGVVDG